MAEVYPLKAPGQWAGADCEVKSCTNYARFLANPMGQPGDEKAFCGHHLSPGIKGLEALHGKAVVVQEVPGRYGNELVVFEGQVVSLAPADRKRK